MPLSGSESYRGQASIETLEARLALSTAPYEAHIDFQPAGSATTAGYVADTGQKVQVHDNGLNYGWSTDMSASAVDRDVKGGGTYNTFIAMGNAAWEVMLPNGLYKVHIAVGDPTRITSVYDLDVNGTTFLTGTPTRKQHTFDVTRKVRVSNGRLILSSGENAVNMKLAGIDVVAVATTTTTNTSALSPESVIQAHGGDIIYRNGIYYWYGENKDAPTTTQSTIDQPRVNVVGISVYASLDLHNWDYRGLAVSAGTGDLSPGGVLERPKVIYNASTKKYVMYMHVDNATYTDSRVGVAVSSSPVGPFMYRGSFKPMGMESRDMTLFQDDDGSAYLIFATDNNEEIRIAQLSANYLSLTGKSVKPFTSSTKREAPQLIKVNGYYYLITSGATWFTPNAAEYAVSTSVMGKYTIKGNPISGSGASTTFNSQGAYAFQVADTGHYYLLADQWNESNLGASKYQFMQLVFNKGTMTIRSPATNWSLKVIQ